MDFNELCIGCRTYRRFQPKEIDAGILDELMENVRIANSAMNAQVLRYVLVREPSLTAAMQPLIHWAGAPAGAWHAEGRRNARGFCPHLQRGPRKSVGRHRRGHRCTDDHAECVCTRHRLSHAGRGGIPEDEGASFASRRLESAPSHRPWLSGMRKPYRGRA